MQTTSLFAQRGICRLASMLNRMLRVAPATGDNRQCKPFLSSYAHRHGARLRGRGVSVEDVRCQALIARVVSRSDHTLPGQRCSVSHTLRQ
jgi:hypothetical protein